MNVRFINPSDMIELKRIHEQFYSDEIFPDFLLNYNSIVVEDDSGNIVTSGGIRLIPEATLITNKDLPSITRGRALIEVLRRLEADARLNNQSSLYAFVANGRDTTWMKALYHYGFEQMKDTPFVKDFSNGSE